MKKSKRGFAREVMLLALPLIVIGGAALFLTKRQNEQKARESGPFRTVITQVETLKITPREAWHGFDRKIRIHFKLEGQPPHHEGIKRMQWYWLKQVRPVEMKGLSQGKTKRAKISTRLMESSALMIDDEVPGPLAVWHPFGSKEDPTLYLLMNTSAFSEGDVTVEGSAAVCQYAHANQVISSAPSGFKAMESAKGTSYSVTSRPIPFSIVVRRSGEVVTPDVDRSGVETKDLGGRLCPPRLQQPPFISDIWGDYRAELQTTDKDGNEDKSSALTMVFLRTKLYDQHNMKVKGWRKWRHWGSTRLNGSLVTTIDVRWRDVPASRGPLWLRGFVSVRGGWPSPFSIQVRRPTDVGRPAHLKVENVRFVAPDQVQVVGRYSGGKTLETFNSVLKPPYDVSDQARTLFAWDKSNDQLLSRWSERLVRSNGREDWDNVKASHVAKQANGRILITYSVDMSKALRVGESATFKADIGLLGEGFVPVQCQVTRFK